MTMMMMITIVMKLIMLRSQNPQQMGSRSPFVRKVCNGDDC